jgi:hypothetical protein
MSKLILPILALCAAAGIAFGAGWFLASSRQSNAEVAVEPNAESSDDILARSKKDYLDWQRAESRRLAMDPDYARQEGVANIKRELNQAGYCVGEDEDGKINNETVSQLIAFSKVLGVEAPDLETASYELLTEFATQMSLWQPEPPPSQADWAKYFGNDTIPWHLSVDAVSGCWKLEGQATEESVDSLYLSIWRYERGVEYTTADWFHGISGGLDPARLGYDGSRLSGRLLASPSGLRSYGLQGYRYSIWVTRLVDEKTLIQEEIGCYPTEPPRIYKRISCPMYPQAAP